MDQNLYLKRMESLTATASGRILDLQLQVVWYQTAIQQKSAWARKVESERDAWKARFYLASVIVIILSASCTALGFR